MENKNHTTLTTTPSEALSALKHAMEEDPNYAWSWQCNLAMMAYDAGAPSKESNEKARDFIKQVFDIDMTPLLEEYLVDFK